MEKFTQVKDDLLDINHPIYNILSSANAPVWWQNIKNDNELYIEIRKDNYLNVYYRGGCVAIIKYNYRTKKIEVSTHPKYLERDNQSNPNWYRKRVKDGKIVYDAIYQDSIDWLSSFEKLESLKSNVANIYSGEERGELTSEKYIQGELIVNNRKQYLDSEFAYRLFDGRRNTIRIDLVKIEDNKIIFEELKRIVDNRLLTSKGDPKILTQMKNYESFLRQNSKVLTKYYRLLFQIKEMLGLPIPQITNIEAISVDPKPTLLIVKNYNKETKGRQERVASIRQILDENGIAYKITD